MPGNPIVADEGSSVTPKWAFSQRRINQLPIQLLWIVVVCLGVGAAASGFLHEHKRKALLRSRANVDDVGKQLDILDDYSNQFAQLFPSAKPGRWSPTEFPLVDWQDRVRTWLATETGRPSNHRWGDRQDISVEGESVLYLSLYPLWVDITLQHEGRLLEWMDNAWLLNPGGIEARGCQVARANEETGLTVHCVFTLAAFSLSDQYVNSAQRRF